MKGQIKGQMIGQVFIYIITLVLVSFLLFYGYRSISSFKEKADQVSYIQFKNDLQGAIKALSLDYGSVKIRQFAAPENIDEVCFVKTFPSMPILSGTAYPVIENSVFSAVPDNVFLLRGSKREGSFFAGNISTPTLQDLFCIDSIGGNIELRMEGRGDHTAISSAR